MNDPTMFLVWELLKKRARGIKNAMTIDEISRRIGLSRRTVEERISRLRELGHPVLSNCSPKAGPLGIFIARSDNQVERWEKQMNSRIARVSHHRKRVSTKFYQRNQTALSLR
jgi:DNA-binding Lrp family transcriptional regulator